MGRRALAPEGPQIRAAARDRDRRVCWQGEAVAAIVATSRAVAEDAAETVVVEYEELDAVTDMRTALDPANPGHSSLAGRQPCLRAQLDAGAVDEAFASPTR